MFSSSTHNLQSPLTHGSGAVSEFLRARVSLGVVTFLPVALLLWAHCSTYGTKPRATRDAQPGARPCLCRLHCAHLICHKENEVGVSKIGVQPPRVSQRLERAGDARAVGSTCPLFLSGHSPAASVQVQPPASGAVLALRKPCSLSSEF